MADGHKPPAEQDQKPPEGEPQVITAAGGLSLPQLGGGVPTDPAEPKDGDDGE